jgi:hypothetical protein
MSVELNRRAFLSSAAALASAGWFENCLAESASKTRLILLGTGGGPRPRKASASSAQAILVNNSAYVIDCGNGVAYTS